MRNIIQKLGRVRVVILLTAVACALAILLDIFLADLFDHEITWHEDLFRASIIPLFMAPFLSWYLIGLLFELDGLQNETNKLATYDSLTNLYNRRVFLQSSESLHLLSKRNKTPYSFFVIDVDSFKKINDTHGHPCGDKVLTALGQRLTEVSRKSDLIGRLGGEEFGFFLPDTDQKHAEEYAKKLQDNINSLEVEYDSYIIKITVSIGISVNTFQDDLSLYDIYKQADKALYSVKGSGKNQFNFFSQ